MAHTHTQHHRARWSEESVRRVDLSGVALVLVSLAAVAVYVAAFPVTPFTALLLVPAAFTAIYGLRHLIKREVRRPRR